MLDQILRCVSNLSALEPKLKKVGTQEATKHLDPIIGYTVK